MTGVQTCALPIFSHKPLASLKKEKIYDELKRSKSELEDRLGVKVSYISLPHGSFNHYVIKTAREVGYEKVCTSEVGYNNGYEYLLKRINIRSEYSMKTFSDIITGRYSFTFLRYAQHFKLSMKNIVGHDNYLKAYHLFVKMRNR